MAIINEGGGMKEIDSEICIVENCPGTYGLVRGGLYF